MSLDLLLLKEKKTKACHCQNCKGYQNGKLMHSGKFKTINMLFKPWLNLIQVLDAKAS